MISNGNHYDSDHYDSSGRLGVKFQYTQRSFIFTVHSRPTRWFNLADLPTHMNRYNMPDPETHELVSWFTLCD